MKKGQLDFVLNAIHDDIEFISYSPIKVFPFLGHPLPNIGSPDKDDNEAGGEAERHRCALDQWLGKMSNLAEAWGLRPDGSNPCRHVKKYREDKRERYLTNEELQRLSVALAQAERTKTENPFVLAAIGLLILTSGRLNEILTLRWEHVDLANGML